MSSDVGVFNTTTFTAFVLHPSVAGNVGVGRIPAASFISEIVLLNDVPHNEVTFSIAKNEVDRARAYNFPPASVFIPEPGLSGVVISHLTAKYAKKLDSAVKSSPYVISACVYDIVISPEVLAKVYLGGRALLLVHPAARSSSCSSLLLEDGGEEPLKRPESTVPATSDDPVEMNTFRVTV